MVILPASDQGLLAGIHQDVVRDRAHHDLLFQTEYALYGIVVQATHPIEN